MVSASAARSCDSRVVQCATTYCRPKSESREARVQASAKIIEAAAIEPRIEFLQHDDSIGHQHRREQLGERRRDRIGERTRCAQVHIRVDREAHTRQHVAQASDIVDIETGGLSEAVPFADAAFGLADAVVIGDAPNPGATKLAVVGLREDGRILLAGCSTGNRIDFRSTPGVDAESACPDASGRGTDACRDMPPHRSRATSRRNPRASQAASRRRYCFPSYVFTRATARSPSRPQRPPIPLPRWRVVRAKPHRGWDWCCSHEYRPFAREDELNRARLPSGPSMGT